MSNNLVPKKLKRMIEETENKLSGLHREAWEWTTGKRRERTTKPLREFTNPVSLSLSSKDLKRERFIGKYPSVGYAWMEITRIRAMDRQPQGTYFYIRDKRKKNIRGHEIVVGSRNSRVIDASVAINMLRNLPQVA